MPNSETYTCWVVFIISASDLHPELISRRLEMEPLELPLPGRFVNTFPISKSKSSQQKRIIFFPARL